MAYPTKAKSDSVDMWAALVVILITAVPMTLWQGFVLRTLWNWFIPLALPGTPRLAVGTAVGLALVVGLFTQSKERAKDQALAVFALERTFEVLIEGSMTLAFGLVVHRLVVG